MTPQEQPFDDFLRGVASSARPVYDADRLWQRVDHSLQKRQPRRRAAWWWWWGGGVAAAMLLLVWVSTSVLNDSNTDAVVVMDDSGDLPQIAAPADFRQLSIDPARQLAQQPTSTGVSPGIITSRTPLVEPPIRSSSSLPFSGALPLSPTASTTHRNTTIEPIITLRSREATIEEANHANTTPSLTSYVDLLSIEPVYSMSAKELAIALPYLSPTISSDATTEPWKPIALAGTSYRRGHSVQSGDVAAGFRWDARLGLGASQRIGNQEWGALGYYSLRSFPGVNSDQSLLSADPSFANGGAYDLDSEFSRNNSASTTGRPETILDADAIGLAVFYRRFNANSRLFLGGQLSAEHVLGGYSTAPVTVSAGLALGAYPVASWPLEVSLLFESDFTFRYEVLDARIPRSDAAAGLQLRWRF